MKEENDRRRKSNLNEEQEMKELKDIKKNDEKKTSPHVKDNKDYEWKYNQLANQDKRVPPTEREDNLDTGRVNNYRKF